MGNKKREVKGATPADSPAAGGGAPSDAESALWKAVKQGDVHEFATLIAKSPSLANSRNKAGETLLVACVDAGETAMIDALLKAGANVNLASNKGRRETPLTSAVWALDDVAVVTLLKHHADPAQRNGEGRTALHIAALNGATEIFLVLLTGVVDAGHCDSGVELVNVMEARVAAADDEDAAKAGAHRPLVLHHPDPIRALAEQCDGGETALHLLLAEFAGGPKFAQLARLLLEFLDALVERHPARRSEVASLINSTTRNGRTPLHYFAMAGCATAAAEAVLGSLLALGADPLLADKEGNNAVLATCAHHSEPKFLAALLRHLAGNGAIGGGKLLPRNPLNQASALHVAAEAGHAALLEVLCSFDKAAPIVDIHAADQDGLPALIPALMGEHARCVAVLLAHGAPKSVVEGFERERETLRRAREEAEESEEDEAAANRGGDFSGHGSNSAPHGATKGEARPPGARHRGAKRPPAAPSSSSGTAAHSTAPTDGAQKTAGDKPSFGTYCIVIVVFLSMLLPVIDWLVGGGSKR